jgi:hypothetical protein
MKNMTDINIVLDRSGSMGSCRQPTIDSFNEFIEGQKNGPDEAIISLYRFDHEYEAVYESRDVAVAPKLSAHNYLPRGSTALLDAIGRTIDGVGARLSNTPEYKRPSKVVVVIITDGEENSSKEYSRSRIFSMIKHQEEAYKWTFVFLGANQDSYTEAGHMGISHHNTLNYAPTARGLQYGTQVLTSNMTKKIRSGPSGQSCSKFFEADEQATSDNLAGRNAAPAVPTGNVFGHLKSMIDGVNEQNKKQVKGTRLDIKKRSLAKSK